MRPNRRQECPLKDERNPLSGQQSRPPSFAAYIGALNVKQLNVTMQGRSRGHLTKAERLKDQRCDRPALRSTDRGVWLTWCNGTNFLVMRLPITRAAPRTTKNFAPQIMHQHHHILFRVFSSVFYSILAWRNYRPWYLTKLR